MIFKLLKSSSSSSIPSSYKFIIKISKNFISNNTNIINRTNPNIIRNVGVCAHIDAGKTTVTERMLYYSNVRNKIGDIKFGDTTMDYDEQERERGITINSAAISFPWKSNTKNNFIVNLIDTPGHVDFTVEVERSLRVLDGAIALFDAVAGVQAQTETVWNQAKRYDVPCIGFINKMDRDGANWERAVESIKDRLGIQPLVTQYPLYDDDKIFTGIIDLVSMNIYLWNKNINDDKILDNKIYDHNNDYGRFYNTYDNIDDGLNKLFINSKYDNLNKINEYKKNINEYKQELINNIIDYDEIFGEYYLNDDIDKLNDKNELINAIRRITINQNESNMIPILFGSGLKNRGIQLLMNTIIDYLPSPNEREPLNKKLNNNNSLISSTKNKNKNKNKKNNLKSGFVFKIQHDPVRGPLAYVRVYEGILKEKDVLYNLSLNNNNNNNNIKNKKNKNISNKERVFVLLHPSADASLPVDDYVNEGDIAVCIGFKNVKTGDILSSNSNINNIIDNNNNNKLPNYLKPIYIPPPVFTSALELDSLSQEKKLIDSLEILTRDDPSLKITNDNETGQLLLSGMGELHLDINKEKLKRDFKLDVDLDKVRIAYRETIDFDYLNDLNNKDYIDMSYTFDQLIGNKQNKAKIYIKIYKHPLGINSNENFVEFIENENNNNNNNNNNNENDNNTKKDNNTKNNIDLDKKKNIIEQSILNSLNRGPLLGYTMQGLKIIVDLNKCDIDDEILATEIAIGSATANLMKNILDENSTFVSLLEPIFDLEIVVPDKSVGTVISDLSSTRRGEIIDIIGNNDNIESNKSFIWENKIIKSKVPMKEIIGYSTTLRSITAGEGSFSYQFDEFKKVDNLNVLEQIRKEN